MKKLIALALVGLMFCTGAIAEGINLDSMTFEQLIELREQIVSEIRNRPEWKEGIVSTGVYKIGVDIPEGKWVIQPTFDSFAYNYGTKLNDTQSDIDTSCLISTGGGALESSFMAGYFGTSVVLNLKKGNYIYITGDCLFSLYINPLF